MGEAKRRGSLEQRIAQSVERKQAEEAARSAEFKRREAERLRNLPPEERKVAILGAGNRHNTRLMLAAALAASAPMLALPPVRRVRGSRQ